MILRHDFEEMKRHSAVFVNTGRTFHLREPYWAIALVTDERGYRYLPKYILDIVIPVRHWCTLLTCNVGKRFEHWVNGKEEFETWVSKEEKAKSSWDSLAGSLCPSCEDRHGTV